MNDDYSQSATHHIIEDAFKIHQVGLGHLNGILRSYHQVRGFLDVTRDAEKRLSPTHQDCQPRRNESKRLQPIQKLCYHAIRTRSQAHCRARSTWTV